MAKQWVKYNNTRNSKFSIACAGIAGLLLTFSFAPFDIWPLTIISLAALFYLANNSHSVKHAFALAYIFSIAGYGAGLGHWIYLSMQISTGSQIIGAIAAPIICLILSTLPAIAIAIYKYISCKLEHKLLHIGLFAACITLVEWLRTFSLMSFPISYAYPHINGPLAAWLPIIGVFGVSFIASITSASLVYILLSQQIRLVLIILVTLLWGSSYPLKQVSWVQPHATIETAIVQANINNQIKWKRQYRHLIIERYMNMTRQVADSDLIVWSENSLPMTYNQAVSVISQLQQLTLEHKNTLMLGILTQARQQQAGYTSTFHNSILTLDSQADEYFYHKYKLLPFGEYTPGEKYFVGLKQFFGIPMSSFQPGSQQQEIFVSDKIKASSYICYEDMFPDYVRNQARGANLLVTVSDDSWFGDSFGPYQHLNIARVRAAELGRYFVRATNTGVSAIIDERGNVTNKSGKLFTTKIVKGKVKLMHGTTPFAQYGSWPVVVFSLLILLAGLMLRWVKRSSHLYP
jgi:apolipoprotein N-acyltransferase